MSAHLNLIYLPRREYGHGDVDGDLEAVVDGGVGATVDIEEDHASLNTPSTSNKRKITGNLKGLIGSVPMLR